MRKHLLGMSCVLAVAACGGGISAEDLPSELEDAQCDYAVRCQGVVDSKTCHDSVDIGAAAGFQTILNGVDDGSIKYDEDAAERCRDYYADLDCTFSGFESESPCNDVFTGTVAAGGACTVDLQCADQGDCEPTDAMCDSDTTCCPGTCVANPEMISQAGGPCADDIHVCADNLYCERLSDTASQCSALITGEGSPCEQLTACASPMYCNIDLFGTGAPSTCKRPAASGAACNNDDLLPCSDDRDYCDPTSMTCVRGVAVGATCGNGISCVNYASCINNTCVADLALGATCVADSETAPECTGSLECINGTCQLESDGVVCL